jgi:flagellar assembly protein FliH
LRVRPEEAARWRAHLAATAQKVSLSIVEDAELGLDDCILETELGSANFSIAAQLKEVEQGFFDVLAQRPPSR